MNRQEMFRLALPEEQRMNLDMERTRVFAAHVRSVMAGELLDGFADEEWLRLVYLYDEHGPLLGTLAVPTNGTYVGPLLAPAPVAIALGAELRDGLAFLKLGVLPRVWWSTKHPGGLITGCMDDEPAPAPLPPTYAEKVEVANAYHRKGLRKGIVYERARISAAYLRCFAGIMKSDDTKAAMARFHRHMEQDVDATIEAMES